MHTRPDWPGRDRGLRALMAACLLTVTVADAGVVVCLHLAGVPWWAAVPAAALIVAGQITLAPLVVLATAGARRPAQDEERELRALVARLSQQADLAPPALAISERGTPAAFATGGGRRATICVTRGLLDLLEPDELAAVVAHELSHVANRDALVTSVAAAPATLSELLLRGAFWHGDPAPRSEWPEWTRPVEGVLFLLALPFWLTGGLAMFFVRLTLVVPMAVAAMVCGVTLPAVRALMRAREYAADRGAAVLTGSPSALASALIAMSDEMETIPHEDLRRSALLNPLLIVPALAPGPSLSRLLSSHPPVRRRVARLMAMQERLDRSPRAIV